MTERNETGVQGNPIADFSNLPVAESFESLVRSEFVVRSDSDREVKLELAEVTRLASATHRHDLPIRKDPFSLVFAGAPDHALEQSSYWVEHPKTGAVEMILVPIGFNEYEAIFN